MDDATFQAIYAKIKGNPRTGREAAVGPATYGNYGPDYYSLMRRDEGIRQAEARNTPQDPNAYQPLSDTYVQTASGGLEPQRGYAGMGDLRYFEQSRPPQVDINTPYSELRDIRLNQGEAPLTGFLGGWNWRQPPIDQYGHFLGPKGETLPNDARGWRPDGKPDFGRGILAFLKGMAWDVAQGKPNEPDPNATYGLTARDQSGLQLGDRKPARIDLTPLGQTLASIPSKAENELPGLGTAVRATGAAAGAALGAFDVPTQALERTMSVGAGLAAEGAKSTTSPLPQLPDIFDDNVGGFTSAYNGLRWLTTPSSWAQKRSDIQRQWDAGAMLYTMAYEPAARAEYFRRVDAGEDPRFAAMELENPIVEAIGRAALDPLNIAGLGGRHLRDLGRWTAAEREALDAAPELLDALKVAQNARTEEEALDGLKTVANIQKTKGQAGARKLVNDWATKRGLGDLTADGARWTAGRTVGQTVNAVAQMGGDTDEYLRALVLMASDSEDDIAQGLNIISHAPAPRILMSPMANTTGQILRRMVGDKPEKLIDAVKAAQKGGIKEVVELVTTKTDDALKTIFPRFNELPKEEFAKLPAWRQAVVKADVAGQRIVGPINGVFNKIYLGYNPAYGMRNLQQNYGSILFDYGPKAIFSHMMETPAMKEARAREWLGGALNPGAEQGFGVAKLVKGGSEAPISKFSAAGERFSSIGISAYTIEKTMKSAIEKGLEIKPLMEAGWSEEAARALKSYVVAARGDVSRAIMNFAKDAEGGYVNALELMNWLEPRDLDFLARLGKHDQLRDIITTSRAAGENVAETQKKVKKFFADMQKAAETQLGREVPTVSRAATGAPGVVMSATDLPDDLQYIATSVYQANHNLAESARKAVEDAIKGMSITDPQGAQALKAQMDNLVTLGERNRTDVFNFQEHWAQWKRAQDARPLRDVNLTQAWNELGMTTPPPTSYGEFSRRFWSEFFHPSSNNMVQGISDQWLDLVNQVVPDGPLKARVANWGEQSKALGEIFGKYSEANRSARKLAGEGKMKEAIESLADQYGISTATKGGTPVQGQEKGKLLAIINRRLKSNYTRLEDIPYDDAERALAREFMRKRHIRLLDETFDAGLIDKAKSIGRTDGVWSKDALKTAGYSNAEINKMIREKILVKTGKDGKGLSFSDDFRREVLGQGNQGAAQAAAAAAPPPAATQPLPNIPPAPYDGEGPPTLARFIHEQKDGITQMSERMVKGVADNWGKVIPANLDDTARAALKDWEKMGVERMAEARATAMQVADANRDFTLLPYGKKRGFDSLLNYVFPYQFWYSRTYTNWLKRLAQIPDVISKYAIYKDTLSKIHAGAPEWWKYQLNTNELFGTDSEDPKFFNLEQSLNPLYGLTGVDFTDDRKRATWYAAALDDLGKVGPSTWTPLNWAVAVAMYMQAENEMNGERKAELQEAIPRWMGRLIPQTATLKTALNLLNADVPGVRGNEFDPFVQFISGGWDMYERRRIGRALWTMMSRGLITEKQAIEAAQTQQGQHWDMAADIASDDRAGGQLSSFFLGAGYKARSPRDLQIDQFYNDYYGLWAMDENMSGDEFKGAMNELRQKYPFMDTVLIANKNGFARDRAYAYNVLSRIPPGQKDDLVKAAGLDGEYYKLYQKFWDDGGRIDKWSQGDRDRFMLAAAKLGALLETPDDATRDEYLAASRERSELERQGKERFGADWDRIDFYMSMDASTAEGRLRRSAYLENNPGVQEAMDWKDAAIYHTPILSAYYGGMKNIDRYLTGKMMDTLRGEYGYGNEIYDKLDALHDQQNQFYKDHPELGEMRDKRDQMYETIDQTVAGRYGFDWEDRIKHYYELKDKNPQQAKAYSSKNRDMWDAKDLYDELEGQMYDSLEAEFGNMDELRKEEEALRKAIEDFETSHEMERYRAALEKKRREVERQIIEQARLIPDRESARWSTPPGYEPDTADQAIIDTLEQEERIDYSRDELRSLMGRSLYDLLEDSISRGDEMDAATERGLEDFAREMDTTVEQVLAWIETAQ